MKTPKTPEDLLRALEAIYSKAKTPLAVKAAKHRADPIIKAWVQTIPPGGREQFGARPFFREWAERQVERLETLALDRLAEGQTPEDKSGFEFKPGLALYNGKDLGLPTGLAIDVLRRLVESWGEVVPYSTLDLNSTDKEAGDGLRAAKAAIQRAFRRSKVPCEIVTKRHNGYLIREKP